MFLSTRCLGQTDDGALDNHTQEYLKQNSRTQVEVVRAQMAEQNIRASYFINQNIADDGIMTRQVRIIAVDQRE